MIWDLATKNKLMNELPKLRMEISKVKFISVIHLFEMIRNQRLILGEQIKNRIILFAEMKNSFNFALPFEVPNTMWI